MTFTWNQNISVADETLDEQHKNLLKQIEALHKAQQAQQAGMGDKAVLETLEFLDDYILTHLLYEESYMWKHKFPDFYAHREIHSGFVRQYNAFKKKFAKNHSKNITRDIYLFLGEWWIGHISVEDDEYQEYITAHPHSHPKNEIKNFHTSVQEYIVLSRVNRG